jgi:uncharacterized phage protein gp47/JayE
LSRLTELQIREFERILLDMINYVRTRNPELTDFNIGSRIRTILESASLEDDEIYNQIGQLTRMFNMSNLKGVDLAERLKERNVYRLSATKASGRVVVVNNALTTSFATTSSSVGDTTLSLRSSKGFPPTADAPYTIRIGEDTANVEDVTVAANNTSTNTLTFGALTKDHAKDVRVSLVTGSAIPIPSGTKLSVEATSEYPEREIVLLETVNVEAGNFESAPILAECTTPGRAGVISSTTDIRFTSGSPFNGASVYISEDFSGGLDTESDRSLLSRGVNKMQALGRSTELALEQLVIGTEYLDSTGRTFQVRSAKSREHFYANGFRDFVYLYIWPGNFDFVSTEDVSTETITSAAEDGQKFFYLDNDSIVPGSLSLQVRVVGTSVWSDLTEGSDYFINEGTGRIEIVDPGLNKLDALRANSYRRYTGLIQEVQRVVNGVESDPIEYQGIAAKGVKVLVTYPLPKAIPSIRISIQADEEVSARLAVYDEVLNYLQELSIGEDVILAEIIERAMGVDGMFNLQVSSPSSDIVLLENEVIDMETIDIVIG